MARRQEEEHLCEPGPGCLSISSYVRETLCLLIGNTKKGARSDTGKLSPRAQQLGFSIGFSATQAAPSQCDSASLSDSMLQLPRFTSPTWRQSGWGRLPDVVQHGRQDGEEWRSLLSRR